jgi:predicted nicotinamide N-methyase
MRFIEDTLAIGEDTVRLAYAREFPGASDDWYWASLWPSAVALADHVAMGDPDWEGKRVLELGCGCGLGGIAAGLKGAEVTVTDVVPEALELAETNWRRNGLEPAGVERLDWCAPGEEDAYDVVLGADILYQPADFSRLLGTLRRLGAPDGRLVVSEPGRPAANGFFARLLRAGYSIDTRHHRIEMHGGVFEVGVSECA